MGLELHLVSCEKTKIERLMDLIFQDKDTLSSSEDLSLLLQIIRTQVPVPDDFAFGRLELDCCTTLGSYGRFSDFRDYAAHLELYGKQRPESNEFSNENRNELEKHGGSRLFPHLMRHPNDSGWYVPIDFPLPFVSSVRQNSFGSSFQLLKELDRIAESLGLIEPEKYFMGRMSYGEAHGWDSASVAEYQSVLKVTDWVHCDSESNLDTYSGEKWITSALIWFCKASIHHKVAIQFC